MYLQTVSDRDLIDVETDGQIYFLCVPDPSLIAVDFEAEGAACAMRLLGFGLTGLASHTCVQYWPTVF